MSTATLEQLEELETKTKESTRKAVATYYQLVRGGIGKLSAAELQTKLQAADKTTADYRKDVATYEQRLKLHEVARREDELREQAERLNVDFEAAKKERQRIVSELDAGLERQYNHLQALSSQQSAAQHARDTLLRECPWPELLAEERALIRRGQELRERINEIEAQKSSPIWGRSRQLTASEQEELADLLRQEGHIQTDLAYIASEKAKP